MELIDKKPLIRHLVDWQMEQFAEVGHEREFNLLNLIIKGIENEPTVEAKEVVHGEWVRTKFASEYICSNCQALTYAELTRTGYKNSNFCPNCGCDIRTYAE